MDALELIDKTIDAVKAERDHFRDKVLQAEGGLQALAFLRAQIVEEQEQPEPEGAPAKE